jgi:amidohydrolase
MKWGDRTTAGRARGVFGRRPDSFLAFPNQNSTMWLKGRTACGAPLDLASLRSEYGVRATEYNPVLGTGYRVPVYRVLSVGMTHKDKAEQAFAAVESELREISRWMYENPELAFAEFESSQKLAAFLADNGFEVTFPAYGLETAFEANAGSSGPRVVICAEYDALPEVGQACGHNIIATAGLGAGVAVAKLADELGIRVTVLGTPAEEGGGGKVELINAGAFADAAASMMVHPSPFDELDPSFQAREAFTVEYFGKDSHAAFAPHAGVNALDGFVQAYMNVATLRQHLLPDDRVHCIINQGGDASNIIPSYTRSTWGVRSGTNERLQELVPKVRACFDAAALATGCRVEVSSVDHPYLNMKNNPVMTSLFKANSESLGRPMPTEAELGGASGGSSDMGNVSQVVPSIHPMVGIDSGAAVNHQKEFAAATVTTSGESAIRDGALAMAYTIIDMAEQDVWNRL